MKSHSAQLSESTWKRLRLMAAARGVTMTAILDRLVSAEFARAERRGEKARIHAAAQLRIIRGQ